MNSVTLMEESGRVIRWEQLKQIFPVSRSTMHRRVAEGRFPKPLRIGKNATAWRASEVQAWLRQRAEER